MSFDILQEFDTLYAQKPTQPSSTQSSSGFSFFDSLASTHANPQKPSGSAFGDAFLPPQRPSSVQLPTQSAYRGIPQPMTRNKLNPLSDNAGSSFNDLVGLLDAPSFVPSPVQQLPTSKPPAYNAAKRSSLGGKDPFAALAGSSGLKKSPPKPHSTFHWGRKSPVIPQQEEVEDFGDFAEASSLPVKTPTLPSRALQDSGNGFRRSLSISTHVPTIPNHSAFPSYPAKTPSNEKLNLSLNSSNTSLSLFDTNGFVSSTTTNQQSNASAADDDFGDFIASPTKSEFPTQYPNSNPLLVTKTIPPTPTTTPIPLGTIPLPAPVTAPVTTTTIKKPPIPSPTLPPLSIIFTAFPTIFSQPATFLFSKLTQHSYPLRQRIFSHPKTKEFLLGTCEAARVAGRVIAGRKTRAKRTKLSGSSCGSDLEVQKEDREIADLVRIWKEECAGRLKAAMVTPRSTPSSHNYSSSDPTAASSNPNASRVPELEVDLRVEKAMGKGGSILDEEDRECVLCGLHQNELVGKLYEHEFGVGGRWWVRGWGHRGCLRWWEEWGGKLVKEKKEVRK